MRSQQEIKQRVQEIKDNDFFGAETGDLIDFLTYENAKEYLKEGVTEDQWKPKPLTEKSIKEAARDYLSFAWDKANNCRGISANRSIDHMRAYAWLLGQEVFEEFEAIEYEHYGKEKLIFISEAVNFDWKAHDDGIRTNG